MIIAFFLKGRNISTMNAHCTFVTRLNGKRYRRYYVDGVRVSRAQYRETRVNEERVRIQFANGVYDVQNMQFENSPTLSDILNEESPDDEIVEMIQQCLNVDAPYIPHSTAAAIDIVEKLEDVSSQIGEIAKNVDHVIDMPEYEKNTTELKHLATYLGIINKQTLSVANLFAEFIYKKTGYVQQQESMV